MIKENIGERRDVDGAREEIFAQIQRHKGQNVIFFDGWDGFGAAPVIRSIAQVLPSIKTQKTPPDLCYDRIIYVDCSAWICEREMHRKIAEELQLDHETIAIFDKQDEEDDFDGVDHGSRGAIRRVSQVIGRTLMSSSFIMVFLNGSDHEIDVQAKFGFIPIFDHVVLWTFKRRLLTMRDKSAWRELPKKLRFTHLFLYPSVYISGLKAAEFNALLREEAAIIVARHPCMQDIDIAVVTDWCLYCLCLHYCFHGTDKVYWAAQAPNFCLYDGITQSHITREIRDALHREINWDCDASHLKELFENFMKDPVAPFLLVKDDTIYQRKPYSWIWISTTSKNMKVLEEMQTIPATTTSLFLCTFSFVLPPFLKCHKLRFLGVDHCSDDKIIKEEESSTEWIFLHNLWVLDIRHTHWDKIISLDKIDLMANLQELNIEGFCCWQYTNKIQERLPDLQRLRITKPTQEAETLVISSSSNSFMDKKKLEILDLSGNRDMKNLPAGLSNASNLQVLIVDGCDGLEDVVSDMLPSSLRNDMVKISKISLQGCVQLENLFVRGLSNLEELNLSGSSIKVLDFETMVADVPMLRRLFLLGCQHLRAIRWGSFNSKGLDVVCVDTRSGKALGFTRPPLLQHESFGLQLHAVLADARLFRSLGPLCYEHGRGNIYFSIHITSSMENGVVQLEATDKGMTELINQLHHAPPCQYGDVLTETIRDASLVSFPQPPNQQLDCHIEIEDGSLALESELIPQGTNLANVMIRFLESLHLHDVVTYSSMPNGHWEVLRWCRVERCPNLETIFPPGTRDFNNQLETIWASDLLKARSIFSKGGFRGYYSFGNLQHLHLCSCPRLQFVLPVWVSTFPSLKTIHIIHCGDLSHVLICEVKMLAPALENIWIRGCFGLRRLPALEGRKQGVKKPAIAIEKDIWDALQWDRAAGHHPELYEAPVHSRHYRRRRLLRGTVLSFILRYELSGWLMPARVDGQFGLIFVLSVCACARVALRPCPMCVLEGVACG
ncbi:hypothetical protein EJB05_37957 [Eragrostis curvula]|uniref:NB-ARC domain-containing protein n=1 Tax=Eragrostis curvula TaxID=38414 RepID=A0A5J9TSW8_9POAL|nr:hypothetical protein EJB05_37957 [Eragrostis curvula]